MTLLARRRPGYSFRDRGQVGRPTGNRRFRLFLQGLDHHRYLKMSSMAKVRTFAALIAVGSAAFVCPASAHVTLETRQAPAGVYYKAVLRIAHGCNGSPTVAVRVRLPENVSDVKPQPKPGWTLETVKQKLVQPYTDAEGRVVTESVREIHWRGGLLLDEHYDEFVFRIRLPNKPGETLYFPTVQECREGTHRWIEIPGPKGARREQGEPAPHLKLLPKSK